MMKLQALAQNIILNFFGFIIGLVDFCIPKKKNLWIFPACHKKNKLFDNGRMLFEEARDHPDVECIVLVKKTGVAQEGYSDYCVSIYSLKGLWLLLRSGVIVVRHGLADIQWPGISSRQHFILNLWHGIPIKGIRYTSIDLQDEARLKHESANYSAIICSSKVDRLAMAASFNIPFVKVWNTGLPRNDLFFISHHELLPFYRQQEDKLLKLLGGRKLVLYAPTFRSNVSGYFSFCPEHFNLLEALLTRENYVLGIRGHLREIGRNPLSSTCKNIINLDSEVIDDAQIVLRQTDILVTDYSSIWVDFLLRKKPIIGLCNDLDQYLLTERGTIYDFREVFPGNICTDFESFYNELERLIVSKIDVVDYKEKRKFFFDIEDGQATRRVFDRLIGREQHAK